MCNKTIIRFGFCDIRNNQGLGKCYQFWPFGSADNTLFYLDLDYSGYHKNHIQYLFVVNIIIIMSLIIIIRYYKSHGSWLLLLFTTLLASEIIRYSNGNLELNCAKWFGKYYA